MALGIGGFTVWGLLRPVPPQVVRSAILTPGNEPLASTGYYPNVVVSPDGTRVVYVAGKTEFEGVLYVKELSQLEGQPLVKADTRIVLPFFSPDGESVGFFDNQTLKKVSVLGGPAVTVAEVGSLPRGASWGTNDTIVFATRDAQELFRVPAAGGEPEVLTNPDGATRHAWPEILPGGEAVLFTILADSNTPSGQIAVLDLQTGEQTILVPDGSSPRYVPTGHLAYASEGTIRAVPFDVARREITGDPVPVLEGVSTMPTGGADFSVAGNGSLVYVAGNLIAAALGTLVWVDRDGREQPLGVQVALPTALSLSPDDQRAAMGVNASNNIDVWVSELARGTLARVTTADNFDINPLWSLDGRRVAFMSLRNGRPEVFWKAADGTGTAELLLSIDDSVSMIVPYDWLPDGSALLVHAEFPDTGRDIGMVSTENGSGTWKPLIQSAANEWSPVISPNGQWLAYTSDETGIDEVYIRRFPELEDRRLVSVGGGVMLNWSSDSSELVYIRRVRGAADLVMRVPIDVSEGDPPSLLVEPAELLFESRYYNGEFGFRTTDVAADGRFLMVKLGAKNDEDAQPLQIILVQNWFEELTRLVPTN